MREALAPAVTGRRHLHQARVEPVLQVTAQNSFLDQHGAGSRRAFVVDVETTAAVGDRAVVDDCTERARDRLADAAGECRDALAVEIASSPWPIASCSRIPGHPGPSTTTISPAGASAASRFVSA